MTDRKGRFALGIGGYVKATAEYDFGGISDDVDFYPSMIPNGGQNYVRNQFQMDATTSTIFLKLVGRTKHLGISSCIRRVTSGRQQGLRAPERLCVFSLVSRWVTIIVPSWIWPPFRPRSIMRGLPDRFSAVPSLLRYERAFGKGWKAGVGIEMPVVDGITNQKREYQ